MQEPRGLYPALLEPVPVCRRRQLPQTPARRSSSPRILPTPPPLSPDFRCPSAFLERRSSGRILPRPPTAEPGVGLSSLCSRPGDRLRKERCKSRNQQEMFILQASVVPSPNSPRSPRSPHSLSPDVATPEPIAEIPLIEASATDSIMTSLDMGSSVDHPLDTPEGTRSQSSSSNSIEQLANGKAGSDCEDPVAHGLDPSLYGPGQQTTTVVCPSPVGSYGESAAVASSSSFSGSEPRPTGLGLVHCSLQHFPVRKRLRVSILKIEALAGQLKPDMEIHAMCKVAIPGMKTGKEQTSEVKRGREPVFNQEFFFDNVTHEDLDTKSVSVSAYHQGAAKLGKDILIGEALIPLREIRELNTKKEIKVIEEIKTQVPKKLGKIHISSCIEKESKRLTINLKKAEDLPRWGFTGAPDVCIKITIQQGAKTQTKSSRVLKSTTSAVYNEAVMFLFDTSKNELAQTKITVSVHDMQRTCTGDDVIGVAYLGTLAQDKSELEQWKNTVEHLGKEYKGTHHLKPQNSSPPVHVAEAGDDEEEEEEEEE